MDTAEPGPVTVALVEDDDEARKRLVASISSDPSLKLVGEFATGTEALAGLAAGGPADRAGVKLGDVVVAVAGERPQGLADLFRRVWALGPAGAEVALTVARSGKRMDLALSSVDRNDFLKKPQLH